MWSAWLDSAWHPTDEARRTDLVAALSEVDLEPLRSWDLDRFTAPVADSIGRAMYWEPPDEQDVVAARPDVIEALQPISAAIATAPGTLWWGHSLQVEAQRYCSLHDTGDLADEPDRGPAAMKLARWKQHTADDEHRAELERPADPRAPYGGHWWSTPAGAGLLRTTPYLPGAGPVGLLWEEDSLGQDQATVWRTTAPSAPRVYEIDGPEAWTDLAQRYPLDVSWGRRHSWYQVTGRAGVWLIPDWEAVSHDWDAVHLTVNGYLSTATRCLALDRTTATMLAGFDPDETFWLTDALTITDATPEHWMKLDSFGSSDMEWQQLPHPPQPTNN